MVVERRFNAEEVLKQAVNAGGVIEILATNHMRNALQSIINNDGEMITGGHIASGDDDVAPVLRPGIDLVFTRTKFMPDQSRSCRLKRAVHVQAPGIRVSPCHACLLFAL